MSVTGAPWAWVTWRRAGGGQYVPRGGRGDDNIAFYGLRKNTGHYIRVESLGASVLVSRRRGASAAATWRALRSRDERWRRADLKNIQSYRPYEPVSIMLPAGGSGGAPSPEGSGVAEGSRGAGGSGGAAQGWGAARGWAAAAVVLALLLLLVRAAENCLHRKLFKAIYMHTIRRHESDEWSTPTVTATSFRHHNSEIGLTPVDDDDIYIESSHPIDLPPPYSECTRSDSTENNLDKYLSEEPPPPYSACYVSYTNPKDGTPTVQINNLRQVFDSTDMDNVHGEISESELPSNTQQDTDRRTELIFDNGRIVERLSLDLNSSDTATGASSHAAVDVPTLAKDGVMYVDETVSDIVTTERVVLV